MRSRFFAFFLKPAVILAAIIISSILLFSLATQQYFTADDWYHLEISNISSVAEFGNFFAFWETPERASFYRPLPTQVFFFVMTGLFGLEAGWWYWVVLAIFAVLIWLVYQLTLTITNSQKIALISSAVYGWSASNFSRVFFLSAFQEICLAVFGILSVWLLCREELESLSENTLTEQAP